MLTSFGVEVRKLRLDRKLRLLDMATMLERSSTYVSAIETGRKPIPDGYVEEIAHMLKLTVEMRENLMRAADQSRKKVKVGGLRGEERELVAAFARRVHTATEDQLEELRKVVFETIFKMSGGQDPFSYRRRGSLVPAMSTEAIWQMATKTRIWLKMRDIVPFPIMDVIELELPRRVDGFYYDVLDREELDGDEARAEPANNRILFAKDVYESACNGEGRARFTAAHELGHLLMHHSVSFARPSDKFPIYRDSEWQADSYAGSLLMPAKIAKGFSAPYEMAEACGVTEMAAEVMWTKYEEKRLI